MKDPTRIFLSTGITRNGIKNGLKLILDVENYDYAYFPRGAKGFRAVVGDSRDKAVINQNGFYIAAGNFLENYTPCLDFSEKQKDLLTL